MLLSCWDVFGGKKYKFIKYQEASGLKTSLLGMKSRFEGIFHQGILFKCVTWIKL